MHIGFINAGCPFSGNGRAQTLSWINQFGATTAESVRIDLARFFRFQLRTANPGILQDLQQRGQDRPGLESASQSWKPPCLGGNAKACHVFGGFGGNQRQTSRVEGSKFLDKPILREGASLVARFNEFPLRRPISFPRIHGFEGWFGVWGVDSKYHLQEPELQIKSQIQTNN